MEHIFKTVKQTTISNMTNKVCKIDNWTYNIGDDTYIYDTTCDFSTEEVCAFLSLTVNSAVYVADITTDSMRSLPSTRKRFKVKLL